MKKQIRQNVFETNSSSTHSLVLQTKEEFNNSYFWENYVCITYDQIRKLNANLNDKEFDEWFKNSLMSDTELKKINNYNFDLSVDDDYYYKIFPAKWVIKNYNNCDLEVKNKNNMIAVSMYKYE